MLNVLTATIVASLVFVSAAYAPAAQPTSRPWLGVHIMIHGDSAAAGLVKSLPDLRKLGVNVLIAEVNYGFQFASHPELIERPGMSKAQAGALADACRENGIRLIPQLNCVGHQSWKEHTSPLLTKYPDFDETPGQFPQNKDIYCRSWCPLHPEVNRVVFALIDELIDAFKADAFHVGMDEIFLIASAYCPRCKGKEPADVFAKAVTDLQQHLVKEKHVEMLMWSDRLLDGKATGYGKWEAATNGTQAAIDRIPKDIICCDWHYGKRDQYPSVPIFLDKGFRVWPAGWDNVPATEALMDFAAKHKDPRMLGHMCTTWGKVQPDKLATFPPLIAAARKISAP
jgi:hypothetical protein